MAKYFAVALNLDGVYPPQLYVYEVATKEEAIGRALEESEEWVGDVVGYTVEEVNVESEPVKRSCMSKENLDSFVQDYLNYGRKIQAIKMVRAVYGCGLKEAKAYVDKLC